MRFLAPLGLALRRLRRRPIRSFLLLQGTVWGVAVAIFPAAVLEGTREATLNTGTQVGADRIAIAADPTSARREQLLRGDLGLLRETLTAEGHDVEALGGVRLVLDAEAAANEAESMPAEEDGTASDSTTYLIEATPEAPRARGQALAKGRWLTETDNADVCVVEARVGKALGRPDLDVGDRIEVEGRSLEVVGRMAPRDPLARRTNDLGFDTGHRLYQGVALKFLIAMGIPVLGNEAWKFSDAAVYVPAPPDVALDLIYVRVPPTQVSAVATTVRAQMSKADRSVLTLYPFVLPVMLGSEVERFDAVNLALFLACLVMGAVVMANLGLLNVLARSREIAIRRTEGATGFDVAAHFLAEGLVLGILGCVFGCALGMGLAHLRSSLEPVAAFTWVFPWKSALMACGVALLVGILAMVLPAIRAARQDPVQGLADD